MGADRGDGREISPTAVWTAFTVILLGFVLAGLGVILASWPVGLVGAAVVVAGGVLAWRVGMMDYVH